MLDTVVAAETPEGIVLELHPAGLTPRFYAFLLDWIIRLVTMYAVSPCWPASMGGVGIAFWLILLFALEWFYPIVFELGRSGATPGKKAFGIKVVMDNGLPITPAASFARNLLRVADFLPFGYGIAVVCMLLRKDCKRLGDLAAATFVVHEPHPAARVMLEKVEPVAPVRSLPPRDQAALVALAARAPTLTGDRLNELAAMAASVSGDQGHAGSCGYAPRARRGAMADGAALVTPLHFEELYQAEWTELEGLLDQLLRRKKGAKGALPIQGERVAVLYRRACEHLALARARSYPAYLLTPLERLTADAHQVIYQRREFGLAKVRHFLQCRVSGNRAGQRRLCLVVRRSVLYSRDRHRLAHVRAAGVDPVRGRCGHRCLL